MRSRWRHGIIIGLLLLVPLARGGWRWRLMTSDPAVAASAMVLPSVVGLPLTGAQDVREVRALIAQVPPDAPVVLIVRAEVPAEVQRYLQYQLDQLAYPRRVEVRPQPSVAGPAREWTIVGPGLIDGDRTTPVAAQGAYRLLRAVR